MRTTIDIPEDLMKEAMKVTNSSTKTELIKIALKNIIQKNNIKSLKKYKGKIDLNIDLNIIRSRDENIN
ncbi:hypothetical protein BMS3Abin03_00893 [bacterium BMS3Abin03]|nr:hypothetical protein BMS3Abin03_00893 [bacterium BMS3Abin03]